MGLITFLAVLGLAIGIHELGHYWACRALGVRVPEFSIGLGPRLGGFRTERTAWNIRAIPIGGYIKMNEEDLEKSTPWKKAIIAVAGPLINLLPFMLLGFYFLGFALVMKLLWLMYISGIQAFGSILLHSIDYWHYFYPLHPVVYHAGPVVKDAADGAMGVVGMGGATIKSVAKIGALWTFLIMFTSISIGLALFNLIPLPPLDGGRIVLAGVEQVAGKRIADKAAVILGVTGALIVIWLLIVITFHDVAKLF